MSPNVLTKLVGTVLGKRADRRGKHKNGSARGDSATTTLSPASLDAAVTSEDLLTERRGVFGKVYIIPLSDLFDIIGTPSERLLSALELICERVLEKHVGDRGPWGEIRGEGYFFSFNDANDQEGWAKANEIVDKIGTCILGGRYKRSSVRLAITQAEDILASGSTDTFEEAKVRAEIESVFGKDSAEVFRDWAELKWKGGPRLDGWRRVEHGNEPGDSRLIPLAHENKTINRAFNPAIWKQRTSGRRHQTTEWKGPERRRRHERRSFARA
ncbi:MAG: hypothetical protein QGI13_12315 [Rhodospirillales bacterium]|jgi:hypothetical protein|nr:hypothetical protein [Rhodospirillales bacterium]